MDCSPPGSSVHWLLQARTLEWIAIPFSRGFSPPRDQTRSPTLQADSFHLSHQGGPHQTKPSFNYYPPQLCGTVIHMILSSFLCICLPLIYPSTSSFPLKFHYCVSGNSFSLVKSLQPYLWLKISHVISACLLYLCLDWGHWLPLHTIQARSGSIIVVDYCYFQAIPLLFWVFPKSWMEF